MNNVGKHVCDGSVSTTASMVRELRRALTPSGGIRAVRTSKQDEDDASDLDSTEEQEDEQRKTLPSVAAGSRG